MAKKTPSPYPLTPRASFSVMPEIFYQASMFLLLLWFLKTVDPGLKIAGVTKKAIEAFRGRLKTARKSPG